MRRLGGGARSFALAPPSSRGWDCALRHMLCRSVRTSQGEDAGGRGDGRWEGRDPTCEVEGGEEAEGTKDV